MRGPTRGRTGGRTGGLMARLEARGLGGRRGAAQGGRRGREGGVGGFEEGAGGGERGLRGAELSLAGGGGRDDGRVGSGKEGGKGRQGVGGREEGGRRVDASGASEGRRTGRGRRAQARRRRGIIDARVRESRGWKTIGASFILVPDVPVRLHPGRRPRAEYKLLLVRTNIISHEPGRSRVRPVALTNIVPVPRF